MDDIKRTIGNTQFGSSLDCCGDKDASLARGYFDADPDHDLLPATRPDMLRGEDGKLNDIFVDESNVGFVHRPDWKSDIERN